MLLSSPREHNSGGLYPMTLADKEAREWYSIFESRGWTGPGSYVRVEPLCRELVSFYSGKLPSEVIQDIIVQIQNRLRRSGTEFLTPGQEPHGSSSASRIYGNPTYDPSAGPTIYPRPWHGSHLPGQDNPNKPPKGWKP